MTDYEISVAFAEAGPCPICKAPGGNCKGDSKYHGSINIIPGNKKDPRATFTVPHRIYEDTKVGSRTVKKLLYAKGDRITPAEAKRLGLIPNDKRKKKETE